ncbi:PIG-L family deacetylase [Nonomuraea sp. NPDC050783]|uniref:PIG-L family deacetylase n=1 Tax=Nonomuraea sp. NPDC050783 TaxID=3154634 RepID=UPI00346518EE
MKSRLISLAASAATTLALVTPATSAALTTIAPAGAYLQVVAHQDDDILFMNPDMAHSLEAGRPVTTVYLTAGEGYKAVGGDPHTPPASCRPAQDLGREQYAGCRMLGVRRAWEKMLGYQEGERPSWDVRAVSVTAPGGFARQVEVNTLTRGDRKAGLVFVNLPDWADGNADTKFDPRNDPTGNDASLYHIWAENSTRHTIIPAGGKVTVRQQYNRGDVLALLNGLFRLFQPTVVRTQDPEPDPRYENPDWLHDHSDHVITARLTAAAVQGGGYSSRLQLVHYRNYNTSTSPVNLAAPERDGKRSAFASYVAMDQDIPLDFDTHPGYGAWSKRLYPRFWAGTRWADRNLHGRLQAFAVQSGRLLTWEQDAGGAWQGPHDWGDPGGPLAPGVTTARNADGRLEVFATRLDTFEVVTTYETSKGDWVGHWDGLGNPNGTTPAARNVGQPAAALNQDRRIQIFVRNGGGGVSTAVQLRVNDAFSGWADLGGGPGVQDGLAATTTPEGEIELFAHSVASTGLGSITQWSQLAPNSSRFAAPASLPAWDAAGPPTVATNADGRLSVFYRLADGRDGDHAEEIGHTKQTRVGGSFTRLPPIAGHGGIGPVAVANAPHPRDGVAAVSDPRIVMVVRNRAGGVSMTRQSGAASDVFDTIWADTGGLIADQPAVVSAANGSIAVLAISGDGRLLVKEQTGPGGGLPFTEWRVVGT